MKQQRWYQRLDDGIIAIYSHPFPDKSATVSLVGEDQLSYYRNNFHLTRAWGIYEEE